MEAPPLSEVRALSGIMDEPLYTHVTAVVVARNEEERIAPLLAQLRMWFAELVVGVQSSSDATRDIAEKYATVIVDDAAQGFGDATMPLALSKVRSRWSFRTDCDEFPDMELLNSMSSATWWAEQHGIDGVWIPFRSWVDGEEWKVPHSHLRLFQTSLGWPPYLHSRPLASVEGFWRSGVIEHRKTLTEHISGYLSYLEVGKGNRGWDEHNMNQLRGAIEASARLKGWAYVTSFPWWDEVKEKVYMGQMPTTASEVRLEP